MFIEESIFFEVPCLRTCSYPVLELFWWSLTTYLTDLLTNVPSMHIVTSVCTQTFGVHPILLPSPSPTTFPFVWFPVTYFLLRAHTPAIFVWDSWQHNKRRGQHVPATICLFCNDPPPRIYITLLNIFSHFIYFKFFNFFAKNGWQRLCNRTLALCYFHTRRPAYIGGGLNISGFDKKL